MQRVTACRAALDEARESEEKARRQVEIAVGVTEQAETRLLLAQIEAGAEAALLNELSEDEGDVECP